MPGDSGEEMAAWRYKGVSKNRGTPKWIVYNGTPYLKWMIFRKHPQDIIVFFVAANLFFNE